MATSLLARYATKYLCNKSLLPSASSIIRSFTTTQDKQSPPKPSTVHTSILGEHIDELEQEYAYDRSTTNNDGDFVGVRGHSSVIDKADFVNARIGDVLEIPYEVTASDFWRVCLQFLFGSNYISINYPCTYFIFITGNVAVSILSTRSYPYIVRICK